MKRISCILLLVLFSYVISAPIKVGVLQSPGGEPREDPWSSNFNPNLVRPKMQQNIDNICNLLTQAGQAGCRIVSTHECIQGIAPYGYYPYNELPGQYISIVQSLIEPIPNATTTRIGQIAATYSMYIVAGMYIKDTDGKFYNAALLFDRSGNIAGMYKKVHLPGFEAWGLTNGNDFPVFQTDFGPIGIAICFDSYFPEAMRALALGGANIIFHPTQGIDFFDGGTRLTDALMLRTRAYENHVFIATSIYGNTGSGIIGQRGQIVVESSSPNSVVTAIIDPAAEVIDASGWWNSIWGTNLDRARIAKSRRPSAYGVLTQTAPPLLARYPNVNLITSETPAALAAAVNGICYSNKAFFTSPGLVRVLPGAPFGYKVTYKNKVNHALTFDYVRLPFGTVSGLDTVYGTAPSSEGADSMMVIMRGPGYNDTLRVKITITSSSIVFADKTADPLIMNLFGAQVSAKSMQFFVNLREPGDYSLTITDVFGKKLWDYEQSSAAKGVHPVSWSLSGSRSAAKSSIGAGRYFAVLTQNGKAVTRQFAVTR